MNQNHCLEQAVDVVWSGDILLYRAPQLSVVGKSTRMSRDLAARTTR